MASNNKYIPKIEKLHNIMKRNLKQTDNMTNLGITTCIYPPEANKQGLPEYEDAYTHSNVTVSGEGKHFASITLPFSSDDFDAWQSYLSTYSANSSVGSSETNLVQEKERLEAVVQSIIELGHEMLPLFAILRRKAEVDHRLSDILKTLQERLNLGINAASSLTLREIEVLELAITGASTHEMAEKLNVKVVTITKRLTRTYRKLNAKNRAEAIHKWLLLRSTS